LSTSGIAYDPEKTIWERLFSSIEYTKNKLVEDIVTILTFRELRVS